MKKLNLLLVSLVFAVCGSFRAAVIFSASSGAWSSASTWIGNTAPSVSDDVIISDGHEVILDLDAKVFYLQIGQGISGALIIGNDNRVRELTIITKMIVMNGASVKPFYNQSYCINNILIGGDFYNDGFFSSTNGAGSILVEFNGDINQNILGSRITAFSDVLLENPFGLTLQQSFSVSGKLYFTTGVIHTQSFRVSLTTDALISGASVTGYIDGNQEIYIPGSGSPQITFEIGDASAYLPLTVGFAGATTGSGSITASTTQGDHPDIINSGINPDLSVNRYYTLKNNGVIGFGVFACVFNFLSGDVDAGANQNNFVVRKFENGSWHTTGLSTTISTNTRYSGDSTFGIYQIGEPGKLKVAVQPVTTVGCEGKNNSFTSSSISIPQPAIKWQRSTGAGFVDITATTDGGVYSNFTTTTLNINGITLGMDQYYYRAVFSNINGTINSDSVILKISKPIVAATTSASVCEGASANLYAGSCTALNFDGLNDYVEVVSSPYLNLYPMTVSALVKTSYAGTGNYGIIAKYAPGSYNGYNVFMTAGHVYANYFVDNSNYCFQPGTHGIDGGSINDNLWHQVAMVVDASGAHLYVDGILKGSRIWTGTAGACTTTEPLYFGRYANGYFMGQMDEIRIWNNAQRPSTILDQINVPVPSHATGLNGYWRFDNGRGTTSTDLTGRGNTGTLKNGITWIQSTAPINLGMIYQWGPATGLNGTIGSAVIANPVTDQIYSVIGTDIYGCVASTTVPVTLHSNPVVTLPPFTDVCSNGSPQMLSGGTPLNGIYSGTGVLNDIFNPAVSGSGTFPINYTYIDENGCLNFATQPLTVNYTSVCVPLTQVNSAYCNIMLTAMSDNLYFDWVSGATNYDVNVVNTSLGYNQTYNTGPATVFRMTNFTNIAFGTIYEMRVRAKVNGVYGLYGSVCTITTNPGPTTQLASGYCNITLSSMSNNLYYDYVSGASNYDVNVVNISLGYDQTITKGASTNFRMTNFTGILPSTIYEIRVRAKINGVFGPYGSVCTVMTPVSLVRMGLPEDDSPTLFPSVSLSVFPNPFTENINIFFTTDETSPVLLNIYDLAGQIGRAHV